MKQCVTWCTTEHCSLHAASGDKCTVLATIYLLAVVATIYLLQRQPTWSMDAVVINFTPTWSMDAVVINFTQSRVSFCRHHRYILVITTGRGARIQSHYFQSSVSRSHSVYILSQTSEYILCQTSESMLESTLQYYQRCLILFAQPHRNCRRNAVIAEHQHLLNYRGTPPPPPQTAARRSRARCEILGASVLVELIIGIDWRYATEVRWISVTARRMQESFDHQWALSGDPWPPWAHCRVQWPSGRLLWLSRSVCSTSRLPRRCSRQPWSTIT